jgi:hypothetical protein
VSGTSNALWSVSFGSGRFVAVGHQGLILTSTNGAAWTPSNSGTTNELSGIGYGDGLFVAAGDNGAILTSADGQDWTAAVSGADVDLYGVGFGEHTFLVVGDSGTILSSTNGSSWLSHNSGTSNEILSVTYGNGQFVAISTAGRILESAPLIGPQLSIDLTPSGFAHVSLRGWSGQQCLIESSTDFTNWLALTNLTLTSPTADYIDPSLAAQSRRFYRALSQ